MTGARAAADIRTAADLPDDCRAPLRDLILALADSKRIMGIRFADWVLGAPELEASIAASSLSQDEWGHSRILYALLKDFGDDPDRLEHAREPAEYCNIEALDEPLATWPDFVVANAIVDTALTVQLEALADSRFVPLRQRVRKQLEEERFHSGHGAAWLRRLGRASDAAHRAVQDALAARWSAVLHWFGPDEFGARPKEERLLDATGRELRARFLARVGPLLDAAGLAAPAAALDFSRAAAARAGADPTRRRWPGPAATGAARS